MSDAVVVVIQTGTLAVFQTLVSCLHRQQRVQLYSQRTSFRAAYFNTRPMRIKTAAV